MRCLCCMCSTARRTGPSASPHGSAPCAAPLEELILYYLLHWMCNRPQHHRGGIRAEGQFAPRPAPGGFTPPLADPGLPPASIDVEDDAAAAGVVERCVPIELPAVRVYVGGMRGTVDAEAVRSGWAGRCPDVPPDVRGVLSLPVEFRSEAGEGREAPFDEITPRREDDAKEDKLPLRSSRRRSSASSSRSIFASPSSFTLSATSNAAMSKECEVPFASMCMGPVVPREALPVRVGSCLKTLTTSRATAATSGSGSSTAPSASLLSRSISDASSGRRSTSFR